MRIGLLNTRSMRKKLLYISESLMEFDIDVLCLTETWLMESDHDLVKAELPNSYSMVQVPRDSHGGGYTVDLFPMLRSRLLIAYHPLN